MFATWNSVLLNDENKEKVIDGTHASCKSGSFPRQVTDDDGSGVDSDEWGNSSSDDSVPQAKKGEKDPVNDLCYAVGLKCAAEMDQAAKKKFIEDCEFVSDELFGDSAVFPIKTTNSTGNAVEISIFDFLHNEEAFNLFLSRPSNARLFSGASVGKAFAGFQNLVNHSKYLKYIDDVSGFPDLQNAKDALEQEERQKHLDLERERKEKKEKFDQKCVDGSFDELVRAGDGNILQKDKDCKCFEYLKGGEGKNCLLTLLNDPKAFSRASERCDKNFYFIFKEKFVDRDFQKRIYSFVYDENSFKKFVEPLNDTDDDSAHRCSLFHSKVPANFKDKFVEMVLNNQECFKHLNAEVKEAIPEFKARVEKERKATEKAKFKALSPEEQQAFLHEQKEEKERKAELEKQQKLKKEKLRKEKEEREAKWKERGFNVEKINELNRFLAVSDIPDQMNEGTHEICNGKLNFDKENQHLCLYLSQSCAWSIMTEGKSTEPGPVESLSKKGIAKFREIFTRDCNYVANFEWFESEFPWHLILLTVDELKEFLHDKSNVRVLGRVDEFSPEMREYLVEEDHLKELDSMAISASKILTTQYLDKLTPEQIIQATIRDEEGKKRTKEEIERRLEELPDEIHAAIEHTSEYQHLTNEHFVEAENFLAKAFVMPNGDAIHGQVAKFSNLDKEEFNNLSENVKKCISAQLLQKIHDFFLEQEKELDPEDVFKESGNENGLISVESYLKLGNMDLQGNPIDGKLTLHLMKPLTVLSLELFKDLPKQALMQMTSEKNIWKGISSEMVNGFEESVLAEHSILEAIAEGCEHRPFEHSKVASFSLETMSKLNFEMFKKLKLDRRDLSNMTKEQMEHLWKYNEDVEEKDPRKWGKTLHHTQRMKSICHLYYEKQKPTGEWIDEQFENEGVRDDNPDEKYKGNGEFPSFRLWCYVNDSVFLQPSLLFQPSVLFLFALLFH